MKDGETLTKKLIKIHVLWEGTKDANEYVNGFKYSVMSGEADRRLGGKGQSMKYKCRKTAGVQAYRRLHQPDNNR
jgi:hypothetical protein